MIYYKKINKKIIFIVSIFFLLVSANLSSDYVFITNTEEKSPNVKFIELNDGDTYELENKMFSEITSFGKSSFFGFSTRDFINKPLIIRSYERHDSEFELLSNYTVDNFIDLILYDSQVITGEYTYLFDNYMDIHQKSLVSPFYDTDITNYTKWRDRIGHDPDHFFWFNIERFGKKEEDINLMVKTFGGGHADYIGQQSWPLDFFHILMKEKISRDIIFSYMISTYTNIEKKIPLTLKKEFVNILDALIVFLDKEIATIKITNKDSEWYETNLNPNSKYNYFKSFLIRRLYTDKIPVLELKNILINLRNSIIKSYPNSKVQNLFETTINNDIVIKDNTTNTLIISSLKSTNKVLIKHHDVIIKCLIDNGVKYYQFEHKNNEKKEFLGLYTDKLNVIRSSTPK